MKLILFVLPLCLSGFIALTLANDLTFTVRVDGVEQLSLKKGLSPAELALMTIETSDANVSISEFEIVLARGSRPVEKSVQVIQGNNYDLANFSRFAKPGDRIVIQLNELSGSEDEALTDQNRAIVIPIR
ncbi:MAG: GldM family protein [Cyclobacteriaceae bacterium]